MTWALPGIGKIVTISYAQDDPAPDEKPAPKPESKSRNRSPSLNHRRIIETTSRYASAEFCPIGSAPHLGSLFHHRKAENRFYGSPPLLAKARILQGLAERLIAVGCFYQPSSMIDALTASAVPILADDC